MRRFPSGTHHRESTHPAPAPPPVPLPARKTVLGGKGPLRRAKQRRAPVSSAPFCNRIMHDGRLRREPDAQPFLRLAKDVNQMAVDKTS
jgi:hypothetical protein